MPSQFFSAKDISHYEIWINHYKIQNYVLFFKQSSIIVITQGKLITVKYQPLIPVAQCNTYSFPACGAAHRRGGVGSCVWVLVSAHPVLRSCGCVFASGQQAGEERLWRKAGRLLQARLSPARPALVGSAPQGGNEACWWHEAKMNIRPGFALRGSE